MGPLVDSLCHTSRLTDLIFHPDCTIVDPIIKVASIPSLKRICLITSHPLPKPPFQNLRDAHSLGPFESLMRDDRRIYNKVVYERYVARPQNSFR